jgi:hypothetical protein
MAPLASHMVLVLTTFHPAVLLSLHHLLASITTEMTSPRMDWAGPRYFVAVSYLRACPNSHYSSIQPSHLSSPLPPKKHPPPTHQNPPAQPDHPSPPHQKQPAIACVAHHWRLHPGRPIHPTPWHSLSVCLAIDPDRPDEAWAVRRFCCAVVADTTILPSWFGLAVQSRRPSAITDTRRPRRTGHLRKLCDLGHWQWTFWLLRLGPISLCPGLWNQRHVWCGHS